MTDDNDTTQKGLWIALYGFALAGAANAHSDAKPETVAERAAQLTEAGLNVIKNRWPDLPPEYQLYVFGGKR